jgi:flavin prenyltransferase
MARYVVGISGASGIILAKRLIEVLTSHLHEVELVMSKAAMQTAIVELGKECSSFEKFISLFGEKARQLIRVHSIQDFFSPIASGSYPTTAMIVIPCSMATVAAIATGLSDNVLRRAADVTLKEKRPLILVPRESPLNEIHLENMLKLARMGVSIVSPVPAWYAQPQTIEDVENCIVSRLLDLLKIENDLYPRWGM